MTQRVNAILKNHSGRIVKQAGISEMLIKANRKTELETELKSLEKHVLNAYEEAKEINRDWLKGAIKKLLQPTKNRKETNYYWLTSLLFKRKKTRVTQNINLGKSTYQ